MIKSIVQFIMLRPNESLMAAGAAILLFKMWKTGNVKTKYHIKDFYKYPDDLLVTGMAVVFFLLGLGGFLAEQL